MCDLFDKCFRYLDAYQFQNFLQIIETNGLSTKIDNLRNLKGQTLLIILVRISKIIMLEELLITYHEFMDPNIQDMDGSTALHYAVIT